MTEQNATTIIGDQKIDRAAMVRLYTERLNGKVSTIIDGHEVNLTAALKQFKWNSTKPINDAVDLELQRMMREGYRTTAGELISFGHDTSNNTHGILSRGFKGFFEPAIVPRSVSAEIVLSKPLIKNTTLESGWNGVVNAERLRIEQAIRKGIAAGSTEASIIADVQKTFGLTRVQASGLVVTATTSVYAQADHAVYKANEKFLKGWQYVAVLDSRTTPLCAHRDGTVYPISDTSHLPPAHWHCRSTTIPVVKRWSDLGNLDSVAATRARNTTGLTPEKIKEYDLEAFKYFDGNAFEKVSYNDWLLRQPTDIQLRHLGDYTKVKMFQNGELTVDKFVTPKGSSLGLRDLREATGDLAGGYNGSVEGTSRVFINAKERLDAIRLGYTTPEEIVSSVEARNALLEYYKLQSGELNGTLSVTNYRGILPHVKKATKSRVLNTPPTDEQLLFNPLTKRREDSRLYQPNKAVNERAISLVSKSEVLTDSDKQFILGFKDEIAKSVGINEAAVVTDNLRVSFERFRRNGEPWGNLKAVLNSQMKHDVTNVSEYIETQLRNNSDFFYKLKQDAFLDPVLGPIQIEDLANNFHKNIAAKNLWEEKVAPKIGRELRPYLDRDIPPKLWVRLEDKDLEEFYNRFAMRLAADDAPDRDQVAIGLGRDLHNLANYRGTKQEWYDLGVKLLDRAKDKGFYELETFGVKKRRMRSRMSGQYFGQYYDTFSVNLKITDQRIKEYSWLNRAVDVGYRIGVNDTFDNALKVRPGFKTYFGKWNYDTRIPITSTSSFSNFPAEFVDDNLADALNWASSTKYKIDPDMHDFVEKLLLFADDKGNAKHYDTLNHYRKYIAARGDAYERFKMMKYYRGKDMEFGSHSFVDHRGRIYDSGFISPQSGETFRPFLSTAESKVLGQEGYENFQDQVGSFLGGLSDQFEGRYNGLSNTGRQKIAVKWRPELVKLGNHIIRAKPNDIRSVLEMPFVQMVEGEEQGKLFRLAVEAAKIDKHLLGNYSDLSRLQSYKTALALEQDASSSGAQIIALTTKNKQLAELSNVVPTHQKRRLYDEIASATFQDPRFKKLNERLGLTEKDLRKAAKAQLGLLKLG
jgi:SPP1 gp7 family putative phage head morphogenesis protein